MPVTASLVNRIGRDRIGRDGLNCTIAKIAIKPASAIRCSGVCPELRGAFPGVGIEA